MPDLTKIRQHNTTVPHILFVEDWQAYIWPEDIVAMRRHQLEDDGYGPIIEMSNEEMPAPFREKFTPGGRAIFPDGKIYEIVCAFRLESSPKVWRFFLQELEHLGSDWVPRSAWGYYLPRIMFECFQDEYPAWQFFEHVFSLEGVVKQFTTSEMLQATFVQQGELRAEVITLATMPDELNQVHIALSA